MAQKLLAGDRVQAQGRVVQDHHLGPVAQGQQQGEPAVLALGQGLDLGLAVDLQDLQQMVCERPIPVGIKAGHPSDDLVYGHPPVHPLVLSHIANPSPDLKAVMLGIKPQDPARAGPGPQQPQQGLDRRSLARAVAAQEAEDRPQWDLQVNPGKDLLATVAEVQVLDLDGGFAHGLPLFCLRYSLFSSPCNCSMGTFRLIAFSTALARASPTIWRRLSSIWPGIWLETNVPLPRSMVSMPSRTSSAAMPMPRSSVPNWATATTRRRAP